MIRENIAIRVAWNSIYYRGEFALRFMTIGGGHDITLSMEGGEQLSLEYLSPGWVEFTLFLSSLTIPGERVKGTAGSTRTPTRVQEDDAPGLHLIILINKNYHFHPHFINHRFIPINLLEIKFSKFFWHCAVD